MYYDYIKIQVDYVEFSNGSQFCAFSYDIFHFYFIIFDLFNYLFESIFSQYLSQTQKCVTKMRFLVDSKQTTNKKKWLVQLVTTLRFYEHLFLWPLHSDIANIYIINYRVFLHVFIFMFIFICFCFSCARDLKVFFFWMLEPLLSDSSILYICCLRNLIKETKKQSNKSW